MKLKIITYYIVLAFLALQLISCDDKESADPLFDATATERINARTKELNDLLLSSPLGWKAVYFTDNKQLGGFTHVFKFNNDGTVDMASDFDATTITLEKSRYSIDLGSTISLVFTTKNRIHLLSDSNLFPINELQGKGYKGDFQFLYQGQENGQLIFRTNRSFQELRFVKATEQDVANLGLSRNMIPNVIGAQSRPLFRILETNDGTTIRKYDFSFAPSPRFAVARSFDNSGLTETKGIGIAYTPDGIIVSPAIEIGNQKLTNFIYESSTGNFIATGTNGVSATIKYSNTNEVLNDDYKSLLPGKPYTRIWYIAPNLGTAPSNSVLFKTLESQVNMTRTISRIQFFFNDPNYDKDSYIQYQLSGGLFLRHTVNVVEDPVTKTIKLVSIKWNRELPNPGGNTLPNVLGPDLPPPPFLSNLDAQLINTPLYVKKESFKIAFSNTIYTIANANGFRITGYYVPG